MMDRRKFLQYMGVAGAGAALLKVNPALAAHKLGLPRTMFVPPPGGPPYPAGPYPSGPYPVTDPSAMVALQNVKYADPLLTAVPVYTPTAGTTYDVQMAPTTATVSSALGNVTKVYAYGQTSLGAAGLHYPGYSFDVPKGTAITVNFTNNLPNGPHLLPIDLTLDGLTVMAVTAQPYPAGYVLPPVGTAFPENRAVVHLHGGDVLGGVDDGWPAFWTVPAASPGITAPQVQTVNYPNTQPGCSLWYHDHAMGITRLNVHAGLAGFYFLRDPLELTGALSFLPGPGKANAAFEVPLVIQDRMFDVNGQFLFPHQGSGGLIANPLVNQQMVWPSGRPFWVPEYFGDVAVVNGTAWPNMNVEKRKYRFRMLNGCNARFLNLHLYIMVPLGSLNTINFNVIGTDQGFLKNTVALNQLFMPTAYRYDAIVDFSKLPIGTKVYLVNDAPGPWPGGGGNVLTEIMSFTVTAASAVADFAIPTVVDATFAPVPGPVVKTRYISLNEWIDPATLSSAGMLLGEGLTLPGRAGLAFDAPVTIQPKVGTTENWVFINRTGDGHPMHLHSVRFQVIDRFHIDAVQFDTLGKIVQVGPSLGLHASDYGWKDTVIAPPGDGVTTFQITVIRANFPRLGFFPYHCHIIDHEDNDMMRWFNVIP